MLEVGNSMYYVSIANSTFNVIEAKIMHIIHVGRMSSDPKHFEYIIDLQGCGLYLEGRTHKVVVKSKETAVQEIEATGCIFATQEKAVRYRMQLLQDRIACFQSALEEAQADLDNIIGVKYE